MQQRRKIFTSVNIALRLNMSDSNIISMMDSKQDLYAKFLCQISGRINEEGTSLMKLYLQAKMLVKAKKLESLKYPSDILMFLDRRKFISPRDLGFLITMLNDTEIGTTDLKSVLQSYYDEIAVDETDHEEKELTSVKASEDRSTLLMDNGSCGTLSQNSVCLKTHNKSNNSSKSDDEKLQSMCFCFPSIPTRKGDNSRYDLE